MYKIPATTLFLGKNLHFMPECHSTNDVLLLLCQKESPLEGALVITANQTAGRGQRGNTWEAEPGKNLTFSFLLKPAFLPVHKQFYLNILVSLGICDLLTELNIQKVQIKWPNDILVSGLKIGGILIENQISGQRFSNVIVGIGLNVNQRSFTISTATSLALLSDQHFDLQETLERLLRKIERRYLQLKGGNYDVMLEEYLSSLYLLNEDRTFFESDRSFEGRILGIDDIGRLRIMEGKRLRVFDIKEIKYT